MVIEQGIDAKPVKIKALIGILQPDTLKKCPNIVGKNHLFHMLVRRKMSAKEEAKDGVKRSKII